MPSEKLRARATGPTLAKEVDQIPVHLAGGPAPDPRWTYTDKAGHKHHCDPEGVERWPTLKWVVDRTYWCEECQEDHDEGHWECRSCGEHIEPGMVTKGPRTVMKPGRITYLIDDVPVSEEEWEAEAAKQEAERPPEPENPGVATAEELHEAWRPAGSKFWHELSDQEQDAWRRLAKWVEDRDA